MIRPFMTTVRAIKAATPARFWFGVAVVVWLLFCLAWLHLQLAAEAKAWQRYIRNSGAPFSSRLTGYELLLHDLHRELPSDAVLGIVGLKPPAGGEIPGTYFFLYPRRILWFTLADDQTKAAAQVHYLVQVSAQPLNSAPDASTVLWVHQYPASLTTPAFTACLMKGRLEPPPQLAENAPREPDKFMVGQQPFRAMAGFALFLAAALFQGFVFSLLLLPAGQVNRLERLGAALTLGLLGIPAFMMPVMLTGLGLRPAILLFVLLAAGLAWRGRAGMIAECRQFRNGLAEPGQKLPVWLWGLLALAVVRMGMCCFIPAYFWDTWMIWLLKARVIWIDNGLQGLFWDQARQLWESHPIYPLAWPVANAVAGVFAGGPCPYIMNWTTQAMLAALLLWVAGTALRHGGISLCGWAVAAFLFFPLLWNPKDFGTADLPMATLQFMAFTLFASGGAQRDARRLGSALVLAVLALAVKLEGVVFLAGLGAISAVCLASLYRSPVPREPLSQDKPAEAGTPNGSVLLSEQDKPVASGKKPWFRHCGWALVLLPLVWYAVPWFRGFPEERLKQSGGELLATNLPLVPQFFQKFGAQFFDFSLPHGIQLATLLPPGLYWALDESLYRTSSYRYLHLPLLWFCLLAVILRFRGERWRAWGPTVALMLGVAFCYPFLYVPCPADLPASIQRLCLQQALLMGAAILVCRRFLPEPPPPPAPTATEKSSGQDWLRPAGYSRHES